MALDMAPAESEADICYNAMVREISDTLNNNRIENGLDKFWTDVKANALARNDMDCPICFNPFVIYKQTALLDCSHMYHVNCIQNYEKFDREANHELVEEGQHSCPMCRHPKYKRIVINL